MNSSTVTNSRKKSRLGLPHNNTDDIITNLHESVLTLILSRLPTTKDAFRTCILSKAWECKWTSSYNLHIVDSWWHQRSTRRICKESFVNFMDKILISSQHRLRSFCLNCKYYRDSSRLQTWISAVLRRGVESFDLVYTKSGFILPCTLLNTTSLRTLKLWHCEAILNVPTKNCLPNLTSLLLYGVHIVNGNANARIVSFTFPVLQTLTLRECKWLNVDSVEIYAPSLTTFFSEPTNINKEYDYSIMIVAPGLTTFASTSGLPEKIILNGSSIVSVVLHADCLSDNIQLLSNIGLRVRNLLNTSTCLELLELSSFVANVSQFGPPLRCLSKLKRLILLEKSNAGQLFELLHAAPSLKFLSINACDWDDSYRGAMESVPSCIVSQLEEVVFRGFYDLESKSTTQYDMIKFFLKNAEQLKKCCVTEYTSYHKPKELRELREILSTIPRCSPYLTVEVVSPQRVSYLPDVCSLIYGCLVGIEK